ncbi:hypothetical protein [Inquilinus limosus]|uniref:hypothetical protein n=1 Tax=Inquilinus limosus TaxID=171674 RepID=UPI00040BF6FD|nr:hypothetical protein [Inquilinus limosus]
MTATSSEPLTLGPLALRLDRNGAFAREIVLDGEELFRGIGFVVRDANWGTPHLPAKARVTRDPGRATATASGTLDHPAGDLNWSVTWTVTDRMIEGRARVTSTSGFETNRTGFVVLHSLGAARGRPVAVTHPDGRIEEARFPELVSPHQPFFDIAGMDYETSAGHRLRLTFEGEVFETEDQRNWTDASYKTYCRPLALPYPYRIEPSAVVEQVVRLEILAQAAAPAVHLQSGEPTVQKTAPLPILGTSLPPGPMTPAQAGALEALGLGFTAIEIDLSDPAWLEETRAKISAVPNPLRIDIRGAAALDMIAAVEELSLVLTRRPMVGVSLWEADDAVVAAARAVLPGVAIGAGTGAFFTELNRMAHWPAADYLAWTSNPTVHGSDDDTIGETTEPLGDILASARAKLPVRRFQIGPMTLGLRYNPNATSPEGRRSAVPPDPRQRQVIAAAWLAGTTAGFLDQDVEALTFFEPAGPKGLIADDGIWTPAAHLLARLVRCAGRTVSVLRWAGRPRVYGLLIQMPEHDALCIAHVRNDEVTLPLPPGAWRRAEMLTQAGFVDHPSMDFRVGPFGVAWAIRSKQESL